MAAKITIKYHNVVIKASKYTVLMSIPMFSGSKNTMESLRSAQDQSNPRWLLKFKMAAIENSYFIYFGF